MSLASVSALDPQDQNAMTEYMDMVNLPLLFQTMIKEVTAQGISDSPQDPHEFLISWLEKNPIHMKRCVPADFRTTIKDMFRHADLDKSGFLDRRELKSVFIGLRTELGLSETDIRALMAEADENADGVIDYEEFCHVAVDVLESIYAKMDYEAELALRKEDARADTSEYLLRGMTQDQLKAILLGVFEKADADGNGTLDPKEFRACLQDTDLGFTKKEVNVMLSEVDANNDGVITYDEFAPLAFDILVELMSKDFISAPTSEDDLANFVTDIFVEKMDPNTGTIAHAAAEEAMLAADMGLSRLKVLACLSEAQQQIQGYGSTSNEKDESSIGSVSDAHRLAVAVAGVVAQIYQSWGY